MHEAMVAAYVRDATFAPMDDETLAPYVAPWLGAEGQEAFYRQIAQNDPRYTDEVQPLYGGIERPVLIVWGEEDRWILLERGRRLHEAIPGSRLETIYPAARTSPRRTPPPPWWSTARTSSACRAATRRLFTHLRGIDFLRSSP
jgi:pimeloyl-ACP methyl ester carboxylesterase